MVLDHYRDAINNGTLPPGSEMPSVVQLAAEWKVSSTTSQRILAALRDEGLIQTRAGKPAIVLEPTERG